MDIFKIFLALIFCGFIFAFGFASGALIKTNYFYLIVYRDGAVAPGAIKEESLAKCEIAKKHILHNEVGYNIENPDTINNHLHAWCIP